MTLQPSGYGGLLNPYEQLEKNGYHLVSINPEMKVADKSSVLRQVVLDYLDALAYMNPDRHEEQARAYFDWLMRDEDFRQRAVELYKRLYGQRLGTVDIWEHTLSDLLIELEDDLMECSPLGKASGQCRGLRWTLGSSRKSGLRIRSAVGKSTKREINVPELLNAIAPLFLRHLRNSFVKQALHLK